MDPISIILGLLLVVVLAGMILIYRKISTSEDSDNDKTIELLQRQISDLTRIQNEKLDRTIKDLNDRLHEQNKTINDQMGKSQNSIREQFNISQRTIKETADTTSKIVKQVTEQLSNLSNTNKQVVGFAEQLQSLENILKNPKQRGVLGEYFLESMLKNVVPGNYTTQYKFKNGEAVDAVVNTKDGFIPIDAKFSLENYNRMASSTETAERANYEKLFKQDLKKRIDETSKYIRPEEGTLDFALMFIPADGLFSALHELRVGTLEINQANLIEYSYKKGVIIVSPSMLFAYLQTILLGLRSLRIEESTKLIQKHVETLRKHLNAYQDHFMKVGNNLEKSVNSYEKATKEFGKIDKDIMKISGEESMLIDSVRVSDEMTTLSLEGN